MIMLCLLLTAPLLSLGGCRGGQEFEASLWVLHDAEGLANLEVYLDDEFIIEVPPGERSAPVGVSLGVHRLTIRSSGSAQALFTQELKPLTARASLIVIGGDEEALSLVEVSDPLPEVAEEKHALELVDLSGLTEPSEVLLSGQDEADFEGCDSPIGMTFTCPVSVLPLSAEADERVSDFIMVNPGADLSISTKHLSELRKVDLLGGEVTTVVIRRSNEASVSLTILRASL